VTRRRDAIKKKTGRRWQSHLGMRQMQVAAKAAAEEAALRLIRRAEARRRLTRLLGLVVLFGAGLANGWVMAKVVG
jgi:hypothetical protein